MSFSPMDSTIVSDARNSDGPTSHQAPLPSPEQPPHHCPHRQPVRGADWCSRDAAASKPYTPHPCQPSRDGDVISRKSGIINLCHHHCHGDRKLRLRGVAPLVHGRGFDATGFVYPGRTARQINACNWKIPLSDITVLAAGTNNIEQQTVTECTKELHQIIDNVYAHRYSRYNCRTLALILWRVVYIHISHQLNIYIHDPCVKECFGIMWWRHWNKFCCIWVPYQTETNGAQIFPGGWVGSFLFAIGVRDHSPQASNGNGRVAYSTVWTDRQRPLWSDWELPV